MQLKGRHTSWQDLVSSIVLGTIAEEAKRESRRKSERGIHGSIPLTSK